MPTYVYRREDGTTFELFQRMTADALETCPTTGQKVQRVIGGGAGLIFKGSGFYETDYVRSKPKEETKTEAKPDSNTKNKSKDTTKKPAAKEED